MNNRIKLICDINYSETIGAAMPFCYTGVWYMSCGEEVSFRIIKIL